MKLVRRHHYIPEALQANIAALIRVKDVMDSHFENVSASLSLTQFADVTRKHPEIPYYLITSEGKISGVITREIGLRIFGGTDQTVLLGDIANKEYAVLSQTATVIDALHATHDRKTAVVLISKEPSSPSAGGVVGIVTDHEIAVAVAVSRTIEFFSD